MYLEMNNLCTFLHIQQTVVHLESSISLLHHSSFINIRHYSTMDREIMDKQMVVAAHLRGMRPTPTS